MRLRYSRVEMLRESDIRPWTFALTLLCVPYGRDTLDNSSTRESRAIQYTYGHRVGVRGFHSGVGTGTGVLTLYTAYSWVFRFTTRPAQ